jgi:mannan endo-1,4-beta-mannosidase
MVNHDGLHNLVWVWDAAAPGFGPDAPGKYDDFFPGLVYVDAIAVNLEDPAAGWRIDASAAMFATGKVVGLGLTGKIPAPELFAQQSNWAWFLASAESTAGPEASEALHKLYDDPRVISRVPESGPNSGAPAK